VPSEPGKAFEHREHVPASIIASKGMNLVNDCHLKRAKEPSGIDVR
jgi:hypothetical protein